MRTASGSMTAEDLFRLPSGRFRYELIDGELKQMAPAGGRHGRIAMELGVALSNHVKANDLGKVYAAETGFLLRRNPDTVRAPDVAFLGRERAGKIGDTEGYIPGAPDLAVEVISPGDAVTEVEEKVADWLRHGAHLVWVVDPKSRMVTVYRASGQVLCLTENDLLDGETVVPGFKCKVGDLF